jgi:serine phosphatase RsbU (regulator of sigma subunit)
MGKGISASVTAMMCSAFLNHYINVNENFILKKAIKELFLFIHPNLLDDEIVSAHFLHFKKETNSLEYAIFSMPPILYLKKGSNEVLKIKTNNLPIANYIDSFKTDSIKLDEIEKFLIYSDGLSENTTKDEKSYCHYINKDFKTSNNLEEFEKNRKEKIYNEEDDITYIYLSHKGG